MGNLSASPTHADALRLASLGLRVHWLEPPVTGDPRSGKQPIGRGWQQRAYTPDPGPAPKPGANLGILTGRVDGAPLCVVAVDLDSPAAVAWAREHLPATPWRTITSHGEHWLYRRPSDTVKVPNKCRLTTSDGTKLEIDIRGDGGNLVVAPSVHPSGHVYSEAEPWSDVSPDQIPVYDPAWLDGRKRSATMGRAPSRAEEPPPVSAPDEPPSERPGVLPEHFEVRLYEQLARGAGGADALAALRAMRDAKPYAPQGTRNNALFQAVRLLAEWFPDATDAQLLDFVRPSVEATIAAGSSNTMAEAADNLTRARAKFAARDHLVLRLIAAGIAPTTAHTTTTDDLTRRLILSFPSGGHVTMRADGSYDSTLFAGPVLSQHVAHENLLGWADRAGVAQFSYTDQEGRRKRLAWQSVLDRHAYPVRCWRGSFDASYSRLDGETFVEAVAPRRNDLTPRFDSDIAAWLATFGGAQHETLLDWLATFPELDKPTAGLVLIGARQAGKNLFVEGLARLWKHGYPTPLETTVTDFNEALQRCPLLFADETLPGQGARRSPLDAHLRELITRSSHQLNRKYQPVVTVEGCVRVVVAMNHSRIEFGAGMNEESKRALAERLLVVRVPAASREYLQQLGGRSVTEAWVAGDALARHVLWLAENRVVKRGSRLLVEGNGEELINHASNSSGINADVCQWLCSYLLNPKALGGSVHDYVRVGGGELWVSSSAWVNNLAAWELFVAHGDTKSLNATALGRALGSLSGDHKKQLVLKSGARSTFHRIDLGQLFAWAERCGFGDVDALRAAVERGSTPPPEPPSEPPPSAPTPDPSNVFPLADRTDLSDRERGVSARTLATLDAAIADARAQIARGEPFKTLDLSTLAGDETPATTPVLENGAPGLDDSCTQVQALEQVAGVSESPRKPRAAKPRAVRPRVAKPAPVPAPRETRSLEYYTPETLGPLEQLFVDRPATVADAVQWFAPRLLAAQSGHPQTYARLTNAYRGYKRGVATGVDAALVCAEAAWFDAAEELFVVTSQQWRPSGAQETAS